MGRAVSSCALLSVALVLGSASPARAQIDLSGEWANRVHEDQPHRVPGPTVGDYTGLPINDAARLRADTWDASIMSLKEHQTQPTTAVYGSHGIANLRLTQVVDDATQRLIAYQVYRSPGTGGTRMIWMDGRPHPPDYAAHTFLGFSTGTWNGNTLVVKTTHLKAGFIQRNGVQHSDRATIVEHFMRHGDYLMIVGVIEDAMSLEEPLVRSWNYVLDPAQRLAPIPEQAVDEIPGYQKGYVPHYLPGQNPYLEEFATRYRLPLAATRGGRETMYPEYAARLRGLAATGAN